MRYTTQMGLLSILFQNPIAFFLVAGILIISITIHEFAHAWVADKLGDPTPRYQGRVTLNPLAHLDPLGTAALLFIGFGWGKPVMFDPYNLKDQQRDTALIALAGPASNILMALVIAIIAGFVGAASPLFNLIVSLSLFYNVMLAIFNLVPVAPLDGSKILMGILPKETAYEFEKFMGRYGMFVLIALIFPWGGGGSPISQLISPIISSVVTGLVFISNLVGSLIG